MTNWAVAETLPTVSIHWKLTFCKILEAATNSHVSHVSIIELRAFLALCFAFMN